MPIQFPDFNRISFDEANPMLVGAERGQKLMQSQLQFPQDLQAKMLANQIAQVQAQYAQPMAKEALTGAQQANQWNPRLWSSQIGLQGAEAGNYSAEARKTNWLLNHPGMMAGDDVKNIEALRQMGLLDSHYQQVFPNTPSGTSPAPQMSYADPNMNPEQATQIANAVVRQQQNMGVPANQTTPQPAISFPQIGNNAAVAGTPAGFDVNGLVRALINKPMTDLQYKQTLTKVMQQNLAGKAFTSMPAQEKEYAIAQARAFGYTGEQASRMFNQGYDLASMAEAKHYDGSNPSSWPSAKGAPTMAIQTRIQRANSTLAALNAVDPEIAASYAKYSPRFSNVSPALIKDMLSGENPNDQADALASYALYPEISALRINAMGGNVGEGAIQNIADAAYARINTLGISPNSHVYQLIQKRISNLLGKMNKAENAAIFGQQQQGYAADDAATAAAGNQDYSGMSDADLQRIAGGS